MKAKIVIPLSIDNQRILQGLYLPDPEDGRCPARDAKFVAIEEDGKFRFLHEAEHGDDCREYYYYPGPNKPAIVLSLSIDLSDPEHHLPVTFY